MPAKEKGDGEEEGEKEKTVHPLIIVLYVILGLFIVSLILLGTSWYFWTLRSSAARASLQPTGSAANALLLLQDVYPNEELSQFDIERLKETFFTFAKNLLAHEQSGYYGIDKQCTAALLGDDKTICTQMLDLAVMDYNSNWKELRDITQEYVDEMRHLAATG